MSNNIKMRPKTTKVSDLPVQNLSIDTVLPPKMAIHQLAVTSTELVSRFISSDQRTKDRFY